MKRFASRFAVPLAVAAIAAVAVAAPLAKSQVMANPSYLPIGVATSGSQSTAWFHEPSTGRVVACQSAAAPGAGLSSVNCVVGKLPYPPAP